MLSENDKKIINRSFFSIKHEWENVVELQSQNKDWWLIVEHEERAFMKEDESMTWQKIYTLFCHHDGDDTYHMKGEYTTILDCVLEIVDHDEWVMSKGLSPHYEELLKEAGELQDYVGG